MNNIVELNGLIGVNGGKVYAYFQLNRKRCKMPLSLE